MTPLLRACFFGNVEIVTALINAKVDVNVQDSVSTAKILFLYKI